MDIPVFSGGKNSITTFSIGNDCFVNVECVFDLYGGGVFEEFFKAEAKQRKIPESEAKSLVEQEAKERGCIGVHLDTFSFQALPFYQKLGYEVFGEIEDHPIGHTRHYVKKLI